ncbi:hypothetical protein P8891_15465 [Bacillus atrophaeus]|uniref:hypothetical protein n=1 Tax=Bacillus atrophaeus TaxID=1452 RepID=UPI002DB8027D|nr:hypothetical protein [Bacillus atrophaeus]MEC0742428.1 hypothetical protein [Bacillus atrophaeus]MEC0744258.1 hypothetical protein [Bacillus atrophaeus]MEC0757248.1 hypothetical protein [Bacillus atrophaeus]MEC0913757.1 hypothetical protein [Bacillus atrophaeus]MEC0960335.1 hypothetical protein [Bacillus atrophaeus]
MIFYQFLSRQLEGEGVKQEEWIISVEQMMNECKQAESVQLTDKGCAGMVQAERFFLKNIIK